MAEITLSGISKTFDKNVEAVCDVDLEVADGELLVLVGPSGCGKSTLLRMVAGLEEVTAGSVVIGGRDVTDLAPKQRDIAMVFQNYALYPHMSVRKNIGYPLRLAKVPKAELDQRVDETAELLHLEEVLERRPSQLSGGQRQRVAMGRALVREPQAFLMDEPLSNLDAKLRVEMRAEIAKIQRELGVTTLYVTHDQTEAMTMGTRVAVLDKGHLQQVDTPQHLYDAPTNRFVAGFIGSPAMNMITGRVARGASGPTRRAQGDIDFVLEIDGQQLVLGGDVLARNPDVRDHVGREIRVGIRPEALADVALEPSAPSELTVEATVVLVESLGAELVVHSTIRGPDGSVPLVARLTPKSRMQPGDAVKLVVDPDGLHLFDVDSGLSLRAESHGQPAPGRP